MLKKLQRATANNHCASLVTAVSAYYDEYSQLPEIDAKWAGRPIPTDEVLINPLVALDDEQNPKRIRFFNTAESKGSSTGPPTGGLVIAKDGENATLRDPWGQPYFVLLDLQYTDEVIDPFDKNRRPLRGRRVIAFSAGPDGKFDAEKPDAEVNKDNIYSWKE